MTTSTANHTPLSLERALRMRKLLMHEHLDCSIRPYRILEIGIAAGADIPSEFKRRWKAAGKDTAARAVVASDYQTWLSGFASNSLSNYLKAILDHVLPVMQTQESLYQLTRDRVEDALADGVIGMKLRFAPQLHRRNGLTLQQVIDPVQQAVSESPIPVRLVVCALRHENGRLGRQLADAVIRNPHVTTFDLAGDESKWPGVLPWWAKQAKRVTKAGKQVSCHIGETNPITDADHEALDAIPCNELGHAIKGDPRKKLCTVCVTSNIVTHQVLNAESHPIDEMVRRGDNVSIDTDGTLFTATTATKEYQLLAEKFGWGADHFLRANLAALEHFPADEALKAGLERMLRDSYKC